MKRAWVAIGAAVMLLAGCATVRDGVRGYSQSVVENTEARRWELTLTNRTDRPLCFSTVPWPNFRGEMTSSTGRLHLESEGEKYYYEPVIDGHCVSCRMRLDPQQTATAQVNFDNFKGVNWEAPPTARRLHWRMTREPCRSKPEAEQYDPVQNVTSIYWPEGEGY